MSGTAGLDEQKQTTAPLVYLAQNFLPCRTKLGVYVSTMRIPKLVITALEQVIDIQSPPKHMCGTDTRLWKLKSHVKNLHFCMAKSFLYSNFQIAHMFGMIKNGNVSHTEEKNSWHQALSKIKYVIFFYFHFCHFPLILNEQTALFFIYKKRFMPFPLRTAPVPKSSKIGFPWCQGPSAAHSQLSQECFQRGC